MPEVKGGSEVSSALWEIGRLYVKLFVYRLEYERRNRSTIDIYLQLWKLDIPKILKKKLQCLVQILNAASSKIYSKIFRLDFFFLPIPYSKMKKIAQLMRDDIKNNNDISQKNLRCLIFLIDVHYIIMSHF